jgi:HPt (histidine-containing phosphotransfer) domain-containing protein
MKQIVHEFVRNLPERSSAILRACQGSDVEAVRRLAHQLSGSAGGYGFPGITDAARAVEHAIRDGLGPEVLQERVDLLASLCRRARAA